MSKSDQVWPEPRVVVTHWVHAEVMDKLAEFSRPVAPTQEQGLWQREQVADQAAEAVGLVVCMADQVDEGLLGACPRLQVVAGILKGTNNIDVTACTQRGVWVTALPDLLTAPTAELVIGLMLAVMRRIVEADAYVRAGRFAGWRPQLYGSGLAGATVGLIGMGRLGQAVARRVRAFEAQVVYWDPQPLPDADAEALGVRLLPLGELLAASDVVVPLVPLTASTYRLVDGRALAALRPGAFVVNAARGSVVDEEAITDALEAGRLGGYGADVFAFEDWRCPHPPRSIPPRLLTHPRTVLTPHLGSAVDSIRRRMGIAAAQQVGQVLAGRQPEGAINRVGGSPSMSDQRGR